MKTTSHSIASLERKIRGATYTPESLSDFVALQLISELQENGYHKKTFRILDPAVGDGELLVSLMKMLFHFPTLKYEIHGFDTNAEALYLAQKRIKLLAPNIKINFYHSDFLEFVSKQYMNFEQKDFFSIQEKAEYFDLVIANPPYVRTQVMGAETAQQLALQFGLNGRVDLYHAFILGMAKVLRVGGIVGVIVSNRFMSTRSGSKVRSEILKDFDVKHIWDLGDTKIFEAAVLPAVLLMKRREMKWEALSEFKRMPAETKFTSIYETKEPAKLASSNPIDSLDKNGIVEVGDGRRFFVQQGKLEIDEDHNGTWRLATQKSDFWLARVKERTWGTFGDIGKIRVGVKTTADKIFIRSDWMQMPEKERPELLRSLTTHHIARRFCPLKGGDVKILYPHIINEGQRVPVNLENYPKTASYLSQHKKKLEARNYVAEAGRKWYEIWVPHNPEAWKKIKLVFRDISERSTFWIDDKGTVINGDCYWLSCSEDEKEELLWLALGVGNSKFIETFYDHMFHNKLYSGRRRFITQYVEQFPLPDPEQKISREIIAYAKKIYSDIDAIIPLEAENHINALVSRAFGVQN
ncbi:MAG TPA: N-6 DNA methylase [Candidatus Omnitrophota bacterium]|nr:N-6 DNA methylase [Candidatus Omnitrophota bacterium]